MSVLKHVTLLYIVVAGSGIFVSPTGLLDRQGELNGIGQEFTKSLFPVNQQRTYIFMIILNVIQPNCIQNIVFSDIIHIFLIQQDWLCSYVADSVDGLRRGLHVGSTGLCRTRHHDPKVDSVMGHIVSKFSQQP